MQLTSIICFGVSDFEKSPRTKAICLPLCRYLIYNDHCGMLREEILLSAVGEVLVNLATLHCGLIKHMVEKVTLSKIVSGF